jgi:MinD-like ATPase involved in chromosome partitioning or flagellar assembly
MKEQQQERKAEVRKTRRVAVINFSGNVGKTTIAAQLLAARMPEAPFYSIESSNVDASADGVKVVRLRGKDYGDLLENIFLADEVIVDVGASNISDFMNLMQQYQASHEVFDYYVVPVVKEKKQQSDTINTIDALAALGVPPEKIKVVFNKVEADDPLRTVFAAIFGAQEVKKNFTLARGAVIFQNEAFEKLKNRHTSIADILVDATDYRAKAREAKSPSEREQAVTMAMIKMLSASAARNLDSVYRTLFL